MKTHRTLPSPGHSWKRSAAALLFWVLACAGLCPGADAAEDEKRLFSFGQKAMEDRLYELAEIQFQNLLAQFPESRYRDPAAWLLAQSRLSQGRWKEALELLEARLPAASAEWQDRFIFLMGEGQLKGELSEAAFQTYQDLTVRFPQSPYLAEAKYGMARALLQQQKFEAAQEMLRMLQKEARKELAARAGLSLGISLFQQKKYEPASELLGKLAQEEANTPVGFQALYALGEMDWGRKQINAARARFEAAVKSDRPEAQSVMPLAFFRLGEIDAAAGNWAAAAANYELAFRKSDESVFRLKCVDELVTAYLKLENPGVLADKLKDWSDENSKTRFGETLLLQVCTLWQRMGKRDLAIRAFQSFLEKYPAGSLDDQAHFQLGWVFLEDKKYESAAAEFQKAAERARSPQIQAEAWLKLGDLNFERRQFDPAAAAYLKSAQVKGADPVKTEQAFYQAAHSFLKARNISEALKACAACGVQFPEGKLAPEFLWLAAEIHRKAGDLQKVADTFKRLADQYPGSIHAPKAWVEYADALYSLGKWKESIQAADLFAEKYPKHEWIPRILLIKARDWERLEQMEKAVSGFESVVQDFPKSPYAGEAQFWLGLYYDGQKNFAKAQEQFELLRKNAPAHPRAAEATYFAARAAYRLGQNKEDVSRLINALVKEYPDSPWIFDGRFLFGDILTERGEFEAAFRIFNDLTTQYDAAKFPKLAERLLEAQGRRGQCLRQLQRHEEAQAAFKSILRSPKADLALRNQAYVELGKTLQNMGDSKGALENYLAPLYEKNSSSPASQGRDFFWICKGGLEAASLLEGRRDWKGAARVLKRLMEHHLPCGKEAEERLRKLQTEHADAN